MTKTMPIHRKDMKLEYVTKKFRHSFDVEHSEYVEGVGWNDTTITRTMPVRAEVTCTLTERASQPLYSSNPATTRWYHVSVFENDRLDSEGKTRIVENNGVRYALTKGRDELIDGTILSSRERGHPEKNDASRIAQTLEERFPMHNVELEITFISGREAVMDKRDHYDKRNIYHPLVEQIAAYVITEAQKLVGEKK